MADESVVSAFSAEHVSKITGLSLQQLARWDREGFFRPSLQKSGPDAQLLRVYSFRDVVGLRIIAVLRNEYKCSVQHLRKVAKKLDGITASPWSTLKLTVSKREVGIIDPADGRARGVLSGQYILVPLIDQIRYVERATAKLSRRAITQVGSTEKKRNVVHNLRVFAGTRVPVKTVQQFLAAGYSVDAILAEYPSLERDDVEMVRLELKESFVIDGRAAA